MPLAWGLKPMLNRGRWGGYAFFINSKIWVVGGYTTYPDGGCDDLSDAAWDIEIFDPVYDKWESPLKSHFNNKVMGSMFGVIGSKIYALGGDEYYEADPGYGGGPPARWTWRDYLVPQVFETKTQKCDLVANAPMKQWCRDAAVATAQDKIYLFGGNTGGKEVFDTVQEFDGKAWHIKKPKFRGAAVTTKTKDGG